MNTTITYIARFLLGLLASVRLGWLIAYDDGPWDIFDRLRQWAKLRDVGSRSRFQLGALLECPYCTSVYFCLIFAFLVCYPSWLRWDWVLLTWGGLTGGVLVVISRMT